MSPFWTTEEDLTDAEQERIKPDTDFESSNPDGAAKSVESARQLSYSPAIESTLNERARAIQETDNDPDVPDRYEDDVFATDQRARQAVRGVFQRGLGAAQGSRGVESSVQWGFARVDEFGGIVKQGEPDDSEYTQDNDLLPYGHPRRRVDDPPNGLGDTPFVKGEPDQQRKEKLNPLFSFL